MLHRPSLASAWYRLSWSKGMLVQAKHEGPKQEASIPADTSQPVCALSGERFDTFWDDAHEEWRFRDAVRLTAEQAAR